MRWGIFTAAWVCVASAMAQHPAPTASPSNQTAARVTPTTHAAVSASEMSTLRALGLTETDWRRYQSVLNGPQAGWSVDKDPLLVLGITATSASERAHFAELYVEADRKRTQAIFEFERAVQQVWKTRYGSEPLFAVPGQSISPVPLLAQNDRVVLVMDLAQSCEQCAEAIKLVQRGESRSNESWGGGVDVYFANASFEQMVAYGRALGIRREEVSAKRITLNQATPAILTQLGLSANALPAAFKRTAQGIVPIPLNALVTQ